MQSSHARGRLSGELGYAKPRRLITRGFRTTIESLEQRTLFSVNIVVHHGDIYNDGSNLAETVLTPANVNATDFGKLFSTTLDGAIYAQPLYVQNVDITRGSEIGVHSVLYVATLHDSLYALDASTGAILWQDSFLNITDPTNLTATTGVTSIPSTALSSDNLGTEYGILATPAIDLNLGEIFVVTNTQEVRGTDTHYVVRLWGLNLSNGTPVLAPTVVGDTISNAASFFTYSGYEYVAGPIVDGTGNNPTPTVYPNTDGWVSAPGGATVPVIAFNARLQMGRTALSLMGGNIYMGFGSHGDHGPYYGWILGYSETTLAITAAFVVTPTYLDIHGDDPDATQQGSVWTSGGSFATDGTNLYITTGNGAFNTSPSNFNSSGFPLDHNYGDSLLKLTFDTSSSPTNQNGNGWGLKVVDYFTPSNALALEEDDLDFGSGGVLLLPNSLTDAAGDPMLMVGGKESRLYLIDRDNMGKFNDAYPTTGQADPRLYDRVLGEYPTDAIDTDTEGIYSTPSYFNGDVYISFAKAAAAVFNVSTFASGTIPPGTTNVPTPLQQSPVFGYPAPTFTISANGSSNGIVWGMDNTASDLQAFDAGNLTAPIYTSNQVTADEFTGETKFALVTVANGMAYLGNTTGLVIGYGLRSSYLSTNTAYFSAPTNLSVSTVSASDVHLSWTSNSSLATEFQIDRSTNGLTWTTLGYVANSVTSFDDTGVAPSTQYQYRVVAISGANATSASNIVVSPPALDLLGQEFYLKLDANGIDLDIWNSSTATGSIAQSVPVSQLSTLAVTGNASGNRLTVDFSNGDPLPASGLSFNGGSGSNSLSIIGNSGTDTVTVGAATITFASSFGSVPIAYTDTAAITFVGGTGSNALTQSAVPGDDANVSFDNITASDTINVDAGSIIIPMPTTGATVPSAQLGTLSIGSGAEAALAAPSGTASHAVLILGALSLAGSSGSWKSQLDLAGNDLILHNGAAATIESQIAQGKNGNWTGQGIISSAAAADPSQFTTLGYLVNNNGSGQAIYGSATPLGLFDGISPAVTDLLIRDSYVGDANLDGIVDGSDYTRIDNGFHNHLTGWINGDFNYDGVVDGSDYTLIDNAYNKQNAVGTARPAFTTAAQSITAGAAWAPIKFQTGDAPGDDATAPTIALASGSVGGALLEDGIAVTSFAAPAGQSSVSFEDTDTQIGIPIPIASVAGITWVPQQQTSTAGTGIDTDAVTIEPLIDKPLINLIA